MTPYEASGHSDLLTTIESQPFPTEPSPCQGIEHIAVRRSSTSRAILRIMSLPRSRKGPPDKDEGFTFRTGPMDEQSVSKAGDVEHQERTVTACDFSPPSHPSASPPHRLKSRLDHQTNAASMIKSSRPGAAAHSESLRLKLSRGQIANFRKVSADYPPWSKPPQKIPSNMIAKRKLASSRSRQQINTIRKSSTLHTVGMHPATFLHSGHRGDPLDVNFTTSHTAHDWIQRTHTASSSLSPNSCRSGTQSEALSTMDQSRDISDGSSNRSCLSGSDLRQLCDRPLPLVPSAEIQSTRRKPPPLYYEQSKPDRGSPSDQIVSGIAVKGNGIVQEGSSSSTPDYYAHLPVERCHLNVPCNGRTSRPPLVADMLHRFSRMPLNEQFEEVLCHSGLVGEVAACSDATNAEDINDPDTCLLQEGEGSLDFRNRPARTVALVLPNPCSFNSDYRRDSPPFTPETVETGPPESGNYHARFPQTPSPPPLVSKFAQELGEAANPFSTRTVRYPTHPDIRRSSELKFELLESARPRFIPSGRSFEPVRTNGQIVRTSATKGSPLDLTPAKTIARPIGSRVMDAIKRIENRVPTSPNYDGPVTPVRALGKILEQPVAVSSADLTVASRKLMAEARWRRSNLGKQQADRISPVFL